MGLNDDTPGIRKLRFGPPSSISSDLSLGRHDMLFSMIDQDLQAMSF